MMAQSAQIHDVHAYVAPGLDNENNRKSNTLADRDSYQERSPKKMKPGIKSPAFMTTAVMLMIGTLVLMSKSKSLFGAMFFVPFALGPLFVSLIIAAASAYRSCQIILTVGSGLYAAWFGYLFLSAFCWNVDAQSPIVVVFIGIYSLPVMIPIWISALILRHRNELKGEQKT